MERLPFGNWSRLIAGIAQRAQVPDLRHTRSVMKIVARIPQRACGPRFAPWCLPIGSAEFTRRHLERLRRDNSVKSQERDCGCTPSPSPIFAQQQYESRIQPKLLDLFAPQTPKHGCDHERQRRTLPTLTFYSAVTINKGAIAVGGLTYPDIQDARCPFSSWTTISPGPSRDGSASPPCRSPTRERRRQSSLASCGLQCQTDPPTAGACLVRSDRSHDGYLWHPVPGHVAMHHHLRSATNIRRS